MSDTPGNTPDAAPDKAPAPAEGARPPAAEGAPAARRYDRRMLEALVCPATRAPLSYDAARQELVSRAAHLAYPIRDGIPIMLVHEARDID